MSEQPARTTRIGLWCALPLLLLTGWSLAGAASAAPGATRLVVQDITRIWSHGYGFRPVGDLESTYVVHLGNLVAVHSMPNGFDVLPISLLAWSRITNVSSKPRGIAAYRLEVAQRPEGPWEAMCPVNLATNGLVWVTPGANGDPDAHHAMLLGNRHMLDSMEKQPIAPGQRIEGWTAWACMPGSLDQCQPAYVRYSVQDSLGQRAQYIFSHAPGTPVQNSGLGGLLNVGKREKVDISEGRRIALCQKKDLPRP